MTGSRERRALYPDHDVSLTCHMSRVYVSCLGSVPWRSSCSAFLSSPHGSFPVSLTFEAVLPNRVQIVRCYSDICDTRVNENQHFHRCSKHVPCLVRPSFRSHSMPAQVCSWFPVCRHSTRHCPSPVQWRQIVRKLFSRLIAFIGETGK